MFFLDLALIFRIAKECKVCCIRQSLGVYVYHGNNASSNFNRLKYYGDAIPSIIALVFKYSTTMDERSEILKLCNNFVYEPFEKKVIINRIRDYVISLRIQLKKKILCESDI